MATVSDTVNAAMQAFRSGQISSDEFKATVRAAYAEGGMDAAGQERQAGEWYKYATTGTSPFLPTQSSYKSTLDISNRDRALKEQQSLSDPFTEYRGALGLAGRTSYNPLQQYQVGQFDPLLDLYNTSQRLYGAEGPLQGRAALPSSFMNYYNAAGTAGKGAGEMLRNIFGADQTQKTTVGETGLGYEPTQYDPATATPEQKASGGLNSGRLAELAQLLKLGMGRDRGTLGGEYAQRRLPMAQQAYYEQQKAGTAGSSNFLDWLNKRWQLGY